MKKLRTKKDICNYMEINFPNNYQKTKTLPKAYK